MQGLRGLTQTSEARQVTCTFVFYMVKYEESKLSIYL